MVDTAASSSLLTQESQISLEIEDWRQRLNDQGEEIAAMHVEVGTTCASVVGTHGCAGL